MLRLSLLLIGVFLVFALLSYVLHYFFKGKRIIKYIPGLTALILAGYNLYLAQQVNTGFEDIARALVAIMLLVGSLGSLLLGVVVDFLIPRLHKK